MAARLIFRAAWQYLPANAVGQYKAHNARVRYGTMTKAEFTAWSKEARAKRADCVAGKLSFEDFVAWLDSDKQR